MLHNVWTVDPLFIYYVPPEQTAIQPPDALLTAFDTAFHDAGCLVYPPAGAVDEYQFAFLPPNLRYGPEDLRLIFPWAGLVDFKRSTRALPYSLAYALPAQGEAPSPSTPHTVDWAPASLAGFDWRGAVLEPGGLVEVTLYFQTHQAVPTEQWFQLSLVSAAQPEVLLASDQGDPCRGIYPAWLWQPDRDPRGQVHPLRAARSDRRRVCAADRDVRPFHWSRPAAARHR